MTLLRVAGVAILIRQISSGHLGNFNTNKMIENNVYKRNLLKN